jgi:glutathione S-transferase
MLLHTNPASPFGRKVAVVAHETGLASRIEIRDELLSPVSPNESVAAANPLGKIPCLVTEGGLALFDSRVIAEYLDGLHDGGRLFPAGGEARWQVLRRQALGDGVADAAVAARYEAVLRPEARRWDEWTAGQMRKVDQSLDLLEQEVADFGEDVDIGQIAVGCALGYLDFRYADRPWREGRPRLAAWFERFDARASMQQTRPRQI